MVRKQPAFMPLDFAFRDRAFTIFRFYSSVMIFEMFDSGFVVEILAAPLERARYECLPRVRAHQFPTERNGCRPSTSHSSSLGPPFS